MCQCFYLQASFACSINSFTIQSTLLRGQPCLFALYQRKEQQKNKAKRGGGGAYFFQTFLTITLLPCSSTLPQTPECSEYYPSAPGPAVNALSLTRLQLPGTKSLFLSIVLTSVSSYKSSLETLSFLNPFLQFHCPV